MTERVDMQFLIDPLPAHFETKLPDIPGQDDIELPDLLNVSGILGAAKLIFSMGQMSDSLIDTVATSIDYLILSLGEFGTDFTFSYSSTASPTITATILVGMAFDLDGFTIKPSLRQMSATVRSSVWTR